MAKTVAEKLQVKPGDRVLVAGAEPVERMLLEPLPPGATIGDLDARDVAVLFAIDRAALEARLEAWLPVVRETRAVWIAYPKGNRADINRDSIWRRVEELGWTLNANVSLDETWSAVRAKPRG